MLRILLLGPLVVQRDGTDVKVVRKMQRALLAYLACQAEPVSRESLALHFWIDKNEETARRHLREELSRLRAQLCDPAAWLVDAERVGLNPRAAASDVLEFQSLARQAAAAAANTPVNTPLPAGVADSIHRALDLWRSPRFADGLALPKEKDPAGPQVKPEVKAEIEEWFTATGAALETLRQRLLERIAQHHAAAGDFERAIGALQQALAADELNEDLTVQMLDWLNQSGRRAEALRACAQTSALFERELGSVPPDVERACARIRRGPADAALPASSGLVPSMGLQVPFVGRSSLLQTLRLAYSRGGTVVIIGEAGSGKTRLVHQLLKVLEPNPPRLLLAPARPVEQALPFQPMIDLLRGAVTREEWRALDPVWRAQLSRLLPELGPAAEAADGQNQAPMYEALRQLFLLLARRGRLLLFLDDLQWCDESSLLALDYLQERGLFAAHGLLVMAARPEEVSAEVEQIRSRVPRSFGFLQIDLPPLDRMEINEFVQVALRAPASPDLLERLAQATGGNTFCLLETLRACLEHLPPEGMISPEELPLSSSVAGLLRERVARLPAEARQALESAAVLGRTFCPDLLEMVSGLGPEEAMLALEELERAHLIQPAEEQSQPGCYTFIHDLFREALVGGLSLARRRLLNQRAAAALEMIWKGRSYERAALLAEHYEAAGAVEPAFDYWLRAARHAMHLFASAETARAFRRAENLLQASGERLPDESIYQLYSEIGDQAFFRTDMAELQRAYATLLRYGQQRRNPLLIGAALSGLSREYSLRWQAAEGLALLDQAMPYLQDADDRLEKMRLFSRRGFFWIFEGDNLQSMANYQYAIGLASGSPDPRIRAELVYAQSFQIYNHCLGGWPLRALSMAERLLEENSPLLSASILIDVHTSAFTACYYAGQYDQAGHHLQMAHELLDKTDRERKRVLLLAVTSRAELAMGNLDACLQASDMMLAYSRANQDRLLEAEAGRARADLMLWLGYPQEALEQYRLAYQVFTLENYVRLEIGARLGYTLGLVGRLDEARALLAQIIAASERLGLGTVSLPARFYQAHLDLLFGEPDAAGDALARLAALRDEGQQRGLLRVYLMVGLALAGAYLQLGEPEAARVLHAQVRQRAAASHALLLEVYACARSGAPAAETQALLARLDAQTQRPELRPYVEGFVARLAAG